MARLLNILFLQARSNPTKIVHEIHNFGCALDLHRVAFHGTWKNLDRLDAQSRITLQHDAVIICGSHHSVEDAIPGFSALAHVLEATHGRIPVFGVCFGAQFLAKFFGGHVVCKGGCDEHGTVQVRQTVLGHSLPWLKGMPMDLDVQQSHFDHIERLPSQGLLVAANGRCPVQAFSLGELTFATQFHPERTPSVPDGVPLCDAQDLPAAHSLIARFLLHHYPQAKR